MTGLQQRTMLTATDRRLFRNSLTANGYHTIDKLLSDEELAAARAQVDAILAGQTHFPSAAFDRERGPTDAGGELVVRKLKDLARNDVFFSQLSRHERILDLVQEIIGPDIKLRGRSYEGCV